MASIANSYQHSVEDEGEFFTPLCTPQTSRPSTPDDSDWSYESRENIAPTSVPPASTTPSPLFSLVSRSRSTSTRSNESNPNSSVSSTSSNSSSQPFRSVSRSSSRSSISRTCQSPLVYNSPTKLKAPKGSSLVAFGEILKDETCDEANALRISYDGSTKCASILPRMPPSNPKSSSIFRNAVSPTTSESDQEDKTSYHKSILQICLENPRKPTLTLGQHAKTRPVFCCNDHEKHKRNKSSSSKIEFIIQASFASIATREQWTENDVQSITHVIELKQTITPSATRERGVQNTSRYFAHFSLSNEYFEVKKEVFEKWDDDGVEHGARSYYTCARHREACQLLTHIKRENVKMKAGLKKPEISARQFAREKRRIRAQQITYGRMEELEELIGKKFSSMKEVMDRFEENDFHLARLSLYYKQHSNILV